ncbi:MAG: hypothetical protein JWM55_1788 [Acidimicrobiaceae bacterium]|nr:hypothetical protein [Acidimicrobiaceae bacterium]
MKARSAVAVPVARTSGHRIRADTNSTPTMGEGVLGVVATARAASRVAPRVRFSYADGIKQTTVNWLTGLVESDRIPPPSDAGEL